MDALNDAAQQRNLYSIGSTVSRRVAAAAATAVRRLDFCLVSAVSFMFVKLMSAYEQC